MTLDSPAELVGLPIAHIQMIRDLTNTYLREFGALPTGPAQGNPVKDDPLTVYGENWRALPCWPPGMGVRDWFHLMDAAWETVNEPDPPPPHDRGDGTRPHKPRCC